MKLSRVSARNLKRASVVSLLAVGLTLSSPARAWFFFFVPLGLFTGKGDSCVSSAAKVGDPIHKPDGSVVVVKSLSGTSSRCSNPDYPLLAEVEASTTTLPPNVSQARIEIPDGWTQQPVTESMKAGGVVMYAHNRTLDAGLQLGAWKRSTVTDVADFVSSRKAAQMSKIKDAEQFPTEQLRVGGLPAWRYEVRGRVPAGMDIKYTATFVEGHEEVVSVLAWTTTPGFEEKKAKLVSIANSITGLAPPVAVQTVPAPAAQQVAPTMTERTSSPSGAPVNQDVLTLPTQGAYSGPSSQSAQKLRELNSLYKEGVITREEFEAKKRQLLDAL